MTVPQHCSLQLMVTLKDLAAIGHAIAVVIHQPRISIFDLFLIILSYLKKGRVVYEGKAIEAKSYLESYPCVQKLPSESDKADWLVDLITEDENRGGVVALPLFGKRIAVSRQSHLNRY
jgi:ABC-type multidrug transport system ATPase subunit